MHIVIDKNISKNLVLEWDPLDKVLQKIEGNKDGMVVCVDEFGILKGVFTDGDFRRHVIKNPSLNLKTPIKQFLTKDVVYANVDASIDRISNLFNEKITFIPLIDVAERVVALARVKSNSFKIEGRAIGKGEPCFIIAEIGNNHNGSFEVAKLLVDLAVKSGADCAKFQMRDLKSLYSNSGNPTDAAEDLGSQYTLDLLTRFQLSKDDMFRIFDYCNHKGILPLCTPWDMKSLENLENYGMVGYKTASADLTNHDLLLSIAQTRKPMICSTGMSSEAEIIESINLLKKNGSQYALLQCNSTYPAPYKDINLAYMSKLSQIGGCPVGYSSHDRGINVCIAAVALGANIIEKHFTLDRNMEGNDHRVSLLPGEFSDLVSGIRQVEEAIGTMDLRMMSQGEVMNRESLAKSLYINALVREGEPIHAHMLDVRSPGTGLQPNKKNEIVGKLAKRDLFPGDLLTSSDLDGVIIKPRKYKFERKFGIPVRYHDFNSLVGKSNFDLLEFHMSYMDLQEDYRSFFNKTYDLDLVVHAPELFKNDHILDLCSVDEKYRKLSINHLNEVIDISIRLNQFFKKNNKPRIIVNVGGFTQDELLKKELRQERYQIFEDSLMRLSLEEVEILPQTMPPFPWHFGGQRFHNLFVDPFEIANICTKNNLKICLDISHSKLSCNFYNWSFSEFLENVGPFVSHMHIADAKGVDGEGLQLGEGDIDFFATLKASNFLNPNASFIPEIWQGHKNNGQEFWRALEFLENYC